MWQPYSSNPKNMVSVFGPDKKRLKNSNENRAKKWIRQGKAVQVKDISRPGCYQVAGTDFPVQLKLSSNSYDIIPPPEIEWGIGMAEHIG